MDFQELKSIIEGLLFLAGEEGLSLKQLAEVTEQRQELVADALEDMKSSFERAERGLQIVQIAGNYQLATLPEHAPYFERLAYSPSRSSLSQAALEALSIIAYRQPITRVEIEEIRGVKSERAIHTLVNKDLIEEVGRADAIGRPILYGTTKAFLDYFGLASLDDLPDLADFESPEQLEEETQLLFQKLEEQQLTFDDVDGEEGAGSKENF
ncbi:segregation and condensation protein B [Paenibacillus macerans]|uniref:Segregation and condensation protein B n=1 Tax=Paenibacillus macerans TaxID=44252 RepID=A0A6N8ES48_PAEMA|nr:SMC-Scp complex subunit ScpB [Paenibacillus macerans]MBS5909491.1 SMC-Scp complex subunit ScpB [Paenibacillus macerans]MDU7474863.1 SMC-Scp complex subunit ScpB [Paenibacillus macerans]MEC0137182.1 SMC-Scp complex subunit ScpB [Paenibacillus macerans]MUG22749.1 SMC-Scp complex subunit ScpB [Paenibacillus macerans]OMG48606.1 SMC-Scp complex subunit ScpB [Paenibacillus macerans]